MKREPKLKEKTYPGWFEYNGTTYQLVVFNDEELDIPHFYLTDKKMSFFCGFKIKDSYETLEYYTGDRHNKLIEDEQLLNALKECLSSIHPYTNTEISDNVHFCWNVINELFEEE